MRPFADRRDDFLANLADLAQREAHDTGHDEAVPIRKLASKLQACCRTPIVDVFDDDRELHIAESRCKHRFCPRCNQFRSWEMRRELTGPVQTGDHH